MFMDLKFFKKPSLIGASVGAIAGLVGITPAEGYGLYSEQLEPYLEIINNLLTGTPGNYIIHGGPALPIPDYLPSSSFHLSI